MDSVEHVVQDEPFTGEEVQAIIAALRAVLADRPTEWAGTKDETILQSALGKIERMFGQ